MPKALKTCPKSNKLPNLVTLVNRLDPTLDPFHCYKSICRWNCPKHISTFGQRLWLSWQSGRFQQQMSVFRNPVIGQFYIDIYLPAVSCIEGTNIKKGDRMWPIETILTILRKHLCIQNLNWWVLTIEVYIQMIRQNVIAVVIPVNWSYFQAHQLHIMSGTRYEYLPLSYY